MAKFTSGHHRTESLRIPISWRRFVFLCAAIAALTLAFGLPWPLGDPAAADGAGAPEPALQRQLMQAARQGELRKVRRLLSHGVNVNGVNANGGTALMYAAVGGHEPVVALLLSHGADVNAQGSTGWGALMLASAKGHVQVVQCLLDAGADVNLRDVYRWTPLMRAVYEQRRGVVEALLKRDTVAINAVTDQGSSALHLAAVVGDRGSVRELVRHGADVRLRDGAGRTAADIAEARGDGALARLLRSPAFSSS